MERRNRLGVRWLRKSARGGIPPAFLSLAYCYEYGVGVRRDPRRALHWRKRAAEQGCDSAQIELGNAYLEGRGVRRDVRRAFAWFERAAEQGDGSSIVQVLELADEHGFPLDRRVAARRLRAAAHAGHPAAQLRLGTKLFDGEGMRRDRVEALRWYRRAAAGEENAAWFNMGLMHKYGEGVRADRARARTCFEQAARLGHAQAAFEVAETYEGERGHAPALRKSLRRLRRLAAGKDPEALCMLGIHHNRGLGVKQSCAAATRLYRESAGLGNAWAMYLLGLNYRYGEGVVRHVGRARYWFRRALQAMPGTRSPDAAEVRRALADLTRRR